MNTNSANLSSSRAEEFAVAIDVNQWRKDIQAFSSTTRRMLDSIHEQLSSNLANGQAQVNLVTPNNPSTELAGTEATASRTTATSTPRVVTREEVETDCEEILAKLKQQLASQLND